MCRKINLMAPFIIAVGALLGGYAVAKATEAEAPTRTRGSRNTERAAAPQATVVAPVQGGNPAESTSIVESVRKFTV
jgi:uncharacterized membrane protein